MKDAPDSTNASTETAKTADSVFALARLLLVPALAAAVVTAALMWLTYGSGFSMIVAVFLLCFMLAVSILLGMMISSLRGKERTGEQKARPGEAEHVRLKKEQEERTRSSIYQDGGEHTVPVSPHQLRALSYEEYLRTPHWKGRREDKLRAVGRRCQVCNRGPRSLHVHHRTYERLGQELDIDLTVLCSTCHNLFHEHGRVSR